MRRPPTHSRVFRWLHRATFDIFGESDPRRMPSHLFPRALHLDYSTAVKADISKQEYSVCPRHWYIDVAFRCARCAKTFVFSAQEQRLWYEEFGFYIDTYAKHCRECRRDLRALKALRQEYDREVALAMKTESGIEQKKRVIELIDSMEEGGVALPAKIRENRGILSTQIGRLQEQAD